MKAYTKLFPLLFFFISSSSFAQFNAVVPVEVGKSPTYISGYYDFVLHDYLLLVTTLGYDANFNSVEDPDDEKPALYKVSYTSVVSGNLQAQKIVDLPFASLPFPTRIGIDAASNLIILPDTNFGIAFYQISDGTKTKTIYPFKESNLPPDTYISAISYSNNLLLVSVRGTATNQFFIVNPETSEIIFETATETNPQQALIQNNKLLILCEGTFGSSNSKLIVYDILDINPNGFNIIYNKTIDLGDTGNHLALMDENNILITINGSHEIHILNTQTLEISKTIKLPTSGYDGPRESNFFNNQYILTTAFDGNLYTFDKDGNQIGKTNLNAKLEGLFSVSFPTLNFYLVAVTSPFTNTYSPNNQIFILVNLSNVEETKDLLSLSASPNPASEFCKIVLPYSVSSKATIEIFTNNGETVQQLLINLVGKELLFPVNHLANGIYFAKVTFEDKILTIPFVVSH